MKILFVISSLFLTEPLGVMLLIAICRKAGYRVRLITLKDYDLCKTVAQWQPDVVAYSTMSTDVVLFKRHDDQLKTSLKKIPAKVFRIMGGAHPTYWPQALDEFGLDAICQGDGDHALVALLARIRDGAGFDDIPNIATSSKGASRRELASDLDRLPFADRQSIYQAVPHYQACGMRSFQASRGCPYNCTYCYNHVYNEMFKDCGKVIRRRTVDSLINEIEWVMRHFQPVRFVRFSDDTFAYRADSWLEEFAQKYRDRIPAVLYCQMRPNTLTDETASLLAHAGCRSISMSIETGDPRVRNEILERNVSNETLVQAFKIAKKYRLNVHANSMIAIPGTSLKDDFTSLEFANQLRPSSPTFGICTPYPGTKIFKRAIESGFLPKDHREFNSFGDLSPLSCYSRKEKETQLRITYLGTVFCVVPKFMQPFILKLIRSDISLKLCLYIGKTYQAYRDGTRVYRWAIPRNMGSFLHLIIDSLKLVGPRSKI